MYIFIRSGSTQRLKTSDKFLFEPFGGASWTQADKQPTETGSSYLTGWRRWASLWWSSPQRSGRWRTGRWRGCSSWGPAWTARACSVWWGAETCQWCPGLPGEGPPHYAVYSCCPTDLQRCHQIHMSTFLTIWISPVQEDRCLRQYHDKCAFYIDSIMLLCLV